ncbi:MAG: Rieske 2Fe-2S domain-containing protein [Chloroflexi bacterium]|nr:Rieske 2Fe-2S domain-containing protein [Chloroflexota bacterium]
MLTQEQNERLTRVGPGTPMGELMRRYWHPIAASVELSEDNPTKEVRLLGEDLVLFRSTAGEIGLIEPSCAHRKANLSYGIPEPEGIRCAYHGWLYDIHGQCVDQPSEPEGSRFKEKVKLKAYRAQELGGLIFAYMGPEPAPLLPRYDMLVWPGVRDAQVCMLPCNWLQCHENSLDPLHFQWLHRYYGGYVMNRKKPQAERDAWNLRTLTKGADHHKIGFEKTSYGVIKRRLIGDETEDDDNWRLGHPVFFPNILRIGINLQFRVPVDDTHTLHMMLNWRALKDGEEMPDAVPYQELPVYDDDGRIKGDWVVGQDQTAWIIQGAITDRTTERLGVTDIGLIMYRRMLEEQMQVVADGGDPLNTHRDPVENEIIVVPCERFEYPGYEGIPGGPFKDIVVHNDVEAVLSGEGVKRPEFVTQGTALDP